MFGSPERMNSLTRASSTDASTPEQRYSLEAGVALILATGTKATGWFCTNNRENSPKSRSAFKRGLYLNLPKMWKLLSKPEKSEVYLEMDLKNELQIFFKIIIAFSSDQNQADLKKVWVRTGINSSYEMERLPEVHFWCHCHFSS